MSLASIKGSDVAVMKTLKTPQSCVKLAFGAMCVVLGIGPDRVSDALAKKNVNMLLHFKTGQQGKLNSYSNNFLNPGV